MPKTKRSSTFVIHHKALSELHLPEALRVFYKYKVLPQEELVSERLLGMNRIRDAEFTCPPMVLVAGEYSVGKTTMLQQILKADYAGARVGAMPTTKGFFILMHGDSNRVMNASAMINDPTFPYQGLKDLGDNAVNYCYLCIMPSPVLKHVTIIDTPGILPNRNPQKQCNVEQENIFKFFAARADLTLFLFDALRPEPSEHVENALSTMLNYEGKLQLLINKVDACDPIRMNFVYDKILCWLSEIVPEDKVPQIYYGSYWNKPLSHGCYKDKLENDLKALFKDISQLSKGVHVRRLNDVTRRARRVRAIALIASRLETHRCSKANRCKKKTMERVLKNDVYPYLTTYHGVTPSDLPPTQLMEKYILRARAKKQPLYTKTNLKYLEEFLVNDLPRFLKAVPVNAEMKGMSEKAIEDAANATWETVNEIAKQLNWHQQFEDLCPINNRLDAKQLQPMIESVDLSEETKSKLWKFIFPNEDQIINENQFYVMKYYFNLALNKKVIPEKTVYPPPLNENFQLVDLLRDEEDKPKRKKIKRTKRGWFRKRRKSKK